MTKSRAGVGRFLTIVASIPKYAIKKFFFFNRNNAELRSICVICISHIGDNLCCLPALSLLRQKYPNAQITFFTSKPLVKLLERNPYSIDIQDYNEQDASGILKLVSRFKLYDVVYPLWHRRELLLAQALWTKSIIAPKSFVYNFATLFKDKSYQHLNVLSVEEKFCSAWVKPEELVDNHVNFSVHHEAQKWFDDQSSSEQTCSEQKKTVYLHFGTQGNSRLWIASNWLTLARYIKSLGFEPVWSGSGRFDEELLKQIDPVSEFQSAVGKYSIDKLAQKLREAEALVTVDTGVFHLAKLTETKTLVLLGGSSFERIAPCSFYEQRNMYFVASDFKCPNKKSASYHCQFNLLKHCPFNDGIVSDCMKSLSVEKVKRAVFEMLKQSK